MFSAWTFLRECPRHGSRGRGMLTTRDGRLEIVFLGCRVCPGPSREDVFMMSSKFITRPSALGQKNLGGAAFLVPHLRQFVLQIWWVVVIVLRFFVEFLGATTPCSQLTRQSFPFPEYGIFNSDYFTLSRLGYGQCAPLVSFTGGVFAALLPLAEGPWA